MNTTIAHKHPPFVYWVGIVAGLAGLLFGFDTGIIAGALPLLSLEFELIPTWQGYVVGAVLLGAIPGVLIAGICSRRYGRKKTILGSAVIFAVTAILCAYAPNVTVLLGTRFLLGIALGIASFVTPVYLSEIAPREVRGALIALYQLMITIGLLSAFLTGVALTGSGSWRWMLGVGFGPALLMFIAFSFMPQSPRWLMLVGRKEEALAVLNQTRAATSVKDEVADIEKSLAIRERPWDLLKHANFRRVLFLGAVLQIMQQMTGINAIMYYAPTIFGSLGFAAGETVMWGAVSVGVVNVLTTIAALFIVDRVGRRPILFCGLAIMTVSLLGMAYCSQPGLIEASGSSFLQWVAVGAVLLYIVGFAMSLGPIVWIICAEVFPLQGRDFGVTFATIVHWSANALLGLSFLVLVREWGIDWVFGAFASISCASIVFVAYFVPETKRVSLETIEFNLNANKPLRKLGM